MTISFVLAGLASNLIIGLLCVAACVVAGVGAHFFFRAKEKETQAPGTAFTPSETSSGMGELRELTSRIETLVTTQQAHGETQRAHLARKVDQVRETVETQHHAVTGLRHELRHEIDKRDAEMMDLRHQLEAVRDGLALPPATQRALPPAEGETFEEASFTETPAQASTFDELAFAPVDPAPPSDAPAGLAYAFAQDDAQEDSLDTDAPSDSLFASQETAFDAVDEPVAGFSLDSALPTLTFEDDTPEQTTPETPAVSAAPVFAFEEPAFEDDTVDETADAMPSASPFSEEALEDPAENEAPGDDATAAPPAFVFESDEPTPAPAARPVFETDAEASEAPALAFREETLEDAATPAASLTFEEAIEEEPFAPEAPAEDLHAYNPPSSFSVADGVAGAVPAFSFEDDTPEAPELEMEALEFTPALEEPEPAASLAFELEQEDRFTFALCLGRDVQFGRDIELMFLLALFGV